MSHTLTSGYESVPSIRYGDVFVAVAVLLTLCFLSVMTLISYPEIAEAFVFAG
jgi:hypothetical protein